MLIYISHRVTPRGGDVPLDLSSKRDLEPVAVRVTPHDDSPAMALPTRPSPKPRREYDKSANIYQEDWLKGYILPPEGMGDF